MHSFPGKNPVVTWTSVFKTMQKFYAKSQKLSRSNSETKKTVSQNLSSFRKIFWRQTFHFWQPSAENARQKRKTLTPKVRKHIKKISVYWSNFISTNSMQFRKSCQKIKPIVSYSSAPGLKLTKKFCFLYLKI